MGKTMNTAAIEPPILRNLLLFGRVLRAAGIPVSPDQSRAFTEALVWVDLGHRDQVFHTARSLLVHRQEDLALFEVIFNRFWRQQGGTGGPAGMKAPWPKEHPPRQPRPVEVISFVGGKPKADASEVDVADKTGTFSPHEVLQRKDFYKADAFSHRLFAICKDLFLRGNEGTGSIEMRQSTPIHPG